MRLENIEDFVKHKKIINTFYDIEWYDIIKVLSYTVTRNWKDSLFLV